MNLLDLIRWHLVVPRLQSTDRDEVIKELIDVFITKGELDESKRGEVEAATFSREQEFSTSIGHRVAFPHGPVGFMDTEIAVLGLSPKGIDFCGHDDLGCQIVLLTLTPMKRGRRYIDLLSHLARVFNNNEFCEALAHAESESEAIELIERRLLEI